MKNSIRSIFGLKKKCNKKATQAQRQNGNDKYNNTNHYSLNPSVSSLSSDSLSNDSTPQTPTSAQSAQDSRGIFRTLEPVWYFKSSLLPNPSMANTNEWIRFDDQSQFQLEQKFSGQPNCVLTHPTSSLGACTISFKKISERPKTVYVNPKHNVAALSNNGTFTSMSTFRANTMKNFELNKDVRRTISPAWWFEQDSPDGSKGMCRFDYRNQVRLEALSEGRTRLQLTDEAFNAPFTVVLEAPKQQELKEEVRGFLYLEPVTSAFQIAYNATNANNKMEELQVQDYYENESEQWDTSLVRRYSV